MTLKRLGCPLVLVLLMVCLHKYSTLAQTVNQTNSSDELDLLGRISPTAVGVKKISPHVLQFTEKFPGIQLHSKDSLRFLKKLYGELSLHLTGHLLSVGQVPILAIHLKHRKLPLLQILLDTKSHGLILRYQGSTSFQRITLNSVLPDYEWNSVAVRINRTSLNVQVDCGSSKVAVLRQPMATLSDEDDASIWLGQSVNGYSRFEGIIFEAKLYHVFTKDSGCDHLPQGDAPQLDEGDQRKSNRGDRLRQIEQRVTQLALMVDMLKTQNNELTARVTELEKCECISLCSHNGVTYGEGESWMPDFCTVCQCLDGRPSCGVRLDVPSCQTPCLTSPCSPQGLCIDAGLDVGSYQCRCEPPYGGPTCENRLNPCIWPVDPGYCNQSLSRYYYDKNQLVCQEFNYTGCGGNINNYDTMGQCIDTSMQGACCYRTYSTSLENIVQVDQQLEVRCEVLHVGECKSLHHKPDGETETEVISFYPGLTCEEVNCVTASKCIVGSIEYNINENFQLGCENCTCLAGGKLSCSCKNLSVRKELRDMTREEIVHFQNAVRLLRQSGNFSEWEAFRDMYMTHSMHIHGGAFFLPWHREFLHRVEIKLQKIDCSIVLPYFDFTTDVGNFSSAAIWQPNYFGGDGEGSCVRDFPFGGTSSWNPCVVRQFNSSISLPTQIELALALASDDYMEMSLCLETFAAYIHMFIGGDMAVSGGPYDPVFFAIHSYIDMLYWIWQGKGQNKFKFPAAYGNIPMIPFNIPPHAVFDLEATCVTYKLPSKGHPCNTTGPLPRRVHPTIKRGDIDPVTSYAEEDFDQFGYNEDGFDRNGYDRFGFNRDGFNRDGFDEFGYDRNGYNRYGFDSGGYNWHGFNVEGFDRNGNPDTSGQYGLNGFDMMCLDRRGLDSNGYDRYGFTVSGYDADYCNFHFNGPFSTWHSLKILDVLRNQGKGFLMTLPRICDPLSPLPDSWVEQHWISNIKIVTGMIPVKTPGARISIPSSRFCFDTKPFLIPCPCPLPIATCYENPCVQETCPAYPDAICRVTFCGECKANWYLNNMPINCHHEREYCSPNPCHHGGTCMMSIWPSEPDKVTCICPPGYDGHLCQYEAHGVCSLPLITGNCDGQQTRWYFNYRKQKCEEFIYTGCGGNSNNFKSVNSCQARCMIGACCYREPLFPRRIIGFDSQGYDRYGFNIEGFDRYGNRRTVNNGIFTAREKYDGDGFDWQGYNLQGYDDDGYDRQGYNRQGFDREGFNLTGYSQIGEYDGIIDYDDKGYDPEGYNRAGYNCYGYNREGFDVFGVSAGFAYHCRSMILNKCQSLEVQGQVEVVQFTRGKRCSEINCGETCGCMYNNKTFEIGEQFQSGCQTCTCSENGAVYCICSNPVKRKEIREMTTMELWNYQIAIRKLQTGFPSKWLYFAETYASHKPQAVGTDAFLPWHRYFLWNVEQALQEFDCTVAIPYYDWTIDVGQPEKSVIWAVNMFGGNGENVTECVQYHPFKKYFPPFLTPCLRRHFDLRVKLPDLVNVKLALRESDYKRFRIKMEIFTKLFQAWVGGHMSSDLSPYDPLFYSYMANIDKLWHDWQLSHNDGLLRYPQRKRYLPMLPFKITPDNVMDLRIQMCIEYLPLTKGAPCNVTEIRNYGYDEFGFDRHGYNREGYDKDGFTVLGFDLEGNPDNRGIYNTRGYSRHGYGRDGYDMSGFDKYGFYVDGYNVDGFDSSGYDRIGYDRYGFNKLEVTPFGLFKNGTYLGRQEVDISLFDEYGYNKYGFNKFGFDSQGYDVFGFDSVGYNKMICNYYHLGPMNVLVKHYVSGKLDKLDNKTLSKIKRICPPVTKLEDWQITTNWLHRDDQVELIETIERVRKKQHGTNTEYRPQKTSVREDLIWVPVAPDESLCIVTHAYDVCPIDMPAVLCTEDLCKGRSCPDHPNAICRTSSCGSCHHEWYEGTLGTPLNCSGCYDDRVQFKQEGETWKDDKCQICTCQNGMVDCHPMKCPPAYCQHPIKPPRECCVHCERGCSYKGKLYPTGTTFDDDGDSCVHCICDRGNVTCRAETCSNMQSCKSPTTTPGSCCPVCMDCGNRVNGSEWNPTPCQKCVCVNGAVHCDKVVCPRQECEHPYTPEGKCCPVCVACFYQGTIYRDGEDFRPDSCTSCHCVHGNVNCVSIDCPQTTCSNPITPPGTCCPVCDSDCEYDMRRYEHNTFFSPSYNPCLNCSCVNSLVRCHSIHCPSVKVACLRPVRKLGECCATHCPKCTDNGVEYNDGETWTPQDGSCRECECRDGLVACRVRQTCSRQCTHGVVRKGECCSPCTDCLYDSRVIPNGRSFIRAGTPCNQCVCIGGNIECQVSGPCPRLPCAATEIVPDQCCPQCRGCDYKGQRYQHGAMVSQDQCSRCICKEGQISCDRITCPTLRCRNPVPVAGQCCPECPSCDYYGRVYDDGQSFISERDPCQNCVCQKGQVTCQRTEQSCPPTPCTHPDKIRGQCCRRCDNCRYERRRIRNGQQFSPGSDPCYTCTCKDGSVNCGRSQCPDVNCLNPLIPTGKCCPVCSSSCLMDGQEYQDGERFPNMVDDCSICTCTGGDVNCQQKTCPSLLCSNPAKLPGECCANCDFCLHDRRIFRNMQRFIHPDDVCQECVCNSGSIVCSTVNCPTLPCSQPMPMPGSCCPVCPKRCTYGGLSYEDGQTFKSPRDKCEECLCLQGRVQCKKMKCPVSSCTNPVEENCCEICEDCFYKNQIFRNGMKFQDPQDTCNKCRCQNGNVWCEKVKCPQVSCRNPVTKDCCPQCNNCNYGGHQYSNRQTFSLGSRCETCTCIDGTVECRSTICAIASCDHPVDGKCCKECSDCLFINRRYNNQQRFTNPRNKCQECTCSDGTVSCSSRPCPRVTCQNPSQGECCPICSDCLYKGRTVRNGLKIPHESDPCKECECRRGNLECFQRQCLNTICRNPVKRRCCLECSECSYNGKEYSNRQRFPDPTDSCSVCQCVDGNVECAPKTCPRVRCSNPVQGACCLECSKCLYQNTVYLDGQDFPHETDSCQTCSCENGNVVCSKKRCPTITCSHPVDGRCCPECGGDCTFERREYKNGEKFQKDCKVCTCLDGNMRCYPKYCPKVLCSNPVIKDCCAVCEDCMFEDRHFKNGQTFPDVKDPCSECFCRNGTFKCSRKPCPEAICQNPAPGRCCPECRNCALHDKVLPHGYRFPGESDPCQTCVCEAGTISCDRKTCDPPTCENPVIDSCGCSACRQCDFEGQQYQNGQEFLHPTENCTVCRCRGGSVSCWNKPCEVTCTHPARDDGCCPLCRDCLYEGKSHLQGTTFTSDVDPCQTCTCQAGNIDCQILRCPAVRCINPIKKPHECCPTCPVCQFLGQTYTDNSRFEHPSDLCQTCSCKAGRVKCEKDECVVPCSHPRQDICCPKCDDCFYEGQLRTDGETFLPDPCSRCTCRSGSVHCEEQTCPKLKCLLKEKVAGECCERCQGCDFRGVQYETDAMWILDDNPCISCKCLGGLVTCMEVECYVPCPNPVSVPGQCCPVCPTCNFDGKRYKDGEVFSPNGDPCDYCTCEDGHLKCVHEACPSVANCPPEQLVDPPPGECCQSCAGFGTTCTRTEIGRRTRPRPEDPCFFCECKDDFNWICMKELCKPLNCPPTVQIFTRGKCCPKCPPCFSTTDGQYHKDGETWPAADNPCVTCQCQNKAISCHIRECPAVQCSDAERLIKTEDGCCERCEAVPDAVCFYQGRELEPGTEWTIDECTRCKCLAGRVKCAIKRCPPNKCGDDEVPSISPGNCCPVCLKQPGSCIVFGDPHYRTFDGTTLHFQGMCKYIMAADCENEDFSVEVQHDDRGAVGEVSWAQNFTVTVAGITIDLLQQHVVRVDGEVVELPFLIDPHVYIERSGNTTLLSTEIGIKLSWNGASYAELSVPGSYKRKTCGLCGNFNGFAQDDLRTKFGLITNSPAVFGNSWKAKTQYKEDCSDVEDVDPCVKAGYRTRKIASSKCAIIKSKTFARCHRLVSPESFFSSCVYDMCACADNPNCLCDILASYAHECAKAKVKIQWRRANLCAIGCDEDKGFMFDDCGPVCARTCENRYSSYGNMTESCFKPCVASCQCAADKVVHNGRCISVSECPEVDTVTDDSL